MNLLFRVEASTQIGTGHLMRCLALAQAWQERGGKAIFAMTTSVPTLEARLKLEGIKVVNILTQIGSIKDAEKTAHLADRLNSDWLVVDGYNFSAEYQRIIKDIGLKLLFIDDYGHANHYYADLVLNQNITANAELYSNREPYTQLLLGTDYALLRREFLQLQGWERINPPIANKILVTMGGADSDNVTLKVITALQLVAVDELEAVIIIGGSNPHYEELKLVSQVSRFPIRLERNVTNMPELMAWADVAVTAGGTTCWELAFMGLPSLFLILADNQKVSAAKLDGLSGNNLGWYKDISVSDIAYAVSQLLKSEQVRTQMSKYGAKLIDGKGVVRILMCLRGEASI